MSLDEQAHWSELKAELQDMAKKPGQELRAWLAESDAADQSVRDLLMDEYLDAIVWEVTR